MTDRSPTGSPGWRDDEEEQGGEKRRGREGSSVREPVAGEQGKMTGVKVQRESSTQMLQGAMYQTDRSDTAVGALFPSHVNL